MMNNSARYSVFVFILFFGVVSAAFGKEKMMGDKYQRNSLNTVTVSSSGDFIAVGDKGTVVHGDDTKINTLDSGAAANLYGVACSSELSVAVGEKGVILVSTDNKKWSVVVSGVDRNLYGIMWSTDKKRFVAVGDNGIILTSDDGRIWKKQNSGVNAPLRAVSYSPLLKKYVIVGSSSTILTSDDGASWTKCSVPNSNLSGIIWSPELKEFISIGHRLRPLGTVATAIEGVVLASSDGVSWQLAYVSGAIAQIRGITYSDRTGELAAVGENGTVITSNDGKKWEYHKSGTNDDLYGITYINGYFVSVGRFGSAFISKDGREWRSMIKENNIEEVILLDVQGLFGGRDLWISGNGDAVVRFVAPRADGPGGLWQSCYSFKLSPEQQERLLQLIKEEDFYNIYIVFRLGGHDEARPSIYIKGEKTYAVAKWETEIHPRFDAIYFYLRDVAQSGRNGTKIEYSKFKWGWKPEGFTPSQQIWDMTTPVDPLK